MAVESIPDCIAANGQYTFCLEDFDLQNVMVDDNGDITGFLDWDGVHIGPMALGAVSYPMWITRDWQRGYGWGNEEEMARYPEDCPEQLSAYRRHYLEAMMACQGSDYDPRWTKLSHILAIVTQAAECYLAFDGLVVFLEGSKVPFNLKDYADSFKVGDTKEKDETIREAFSNIWNAYEETPNQIHKSHRPVCESDEEGEDGAEHDDWDNATQDDDDDVADAAEQEEVSDQAKTEDSDAGQAMEADSLP